MATLQTIRNRAGLLISIIIGLALVAFILGDFLRKNGSSPSDYEVAEIAGTSIPLQLYQQKVDELTENAKRNNNNQNIDEATMEQIREQAWESIIRDNVLGEEIKSLGVDISDDELFDIVQGNNIHPQIQQIPIFKNEQTGQFDKNLVIKFLKNMDKDESGQARTSWVAFEKSLAQVQVNSKYNNLIKKGLYITSYQAKLESQEKNEKADVRFVYENFNTISDSTIKVSDAELKAYYDENLYKFDQEAERILEYVVYDVIPSKEDYKMSEEWINKIKPEFASTDNDKQFVNLNSDVPVVDKYNKKGELPQNIDSVLFNAPKGTMFGPYFEGSSYKIAKVTEIKMLPDTVKASHILISPEKAGSLEKAQATIDSLKKLVDGGASFEELAMKYGTDGTKDKGGDLGWFKREDMVSPFNDTCFFGKVGDVKTVTTQFGVHLVKIVGRGVESRKVLVSTLERVVEPSQTTFDSFYKSASEFAGKNRTQQSFNSSITAQSLVKRVSPALKETDKQIPGLENPREIIRWAYNDAEKGEVSNVFDLNGKYVVAVLTEVKEKGTAPMEQVKDLITAEVRKDKKAKMLTDKFSASMKTAKTIEELASSLKLKADTVNGVTFASNSMPMVGFEPALIVGSVVLPKQKISQPLKGKNGVFVLYIENKTITPVKDTKPEADMLSNGVQSRVDYEVYEALKKAAEIKDYRIKYF